MIEDAELLRCYFEERSEAAFAELVRRRIDLVYSVARRQVSGDAQLAEDVTQKVFADLARKGKSLLGRPVLSGWLYRSAQFAAADVVRAERRRRVREQEALIMNDDEATTGNEGVIDWEKVKPVLDDVLTELGENDRDAVALRYFEERSFSEIGRALQLTEEAARKRVERALAKLHGLLARRGVTSTTAALGLALTNQGAMAAPVGLAASVSGVALAGAASVGGAGVAVTFLTMSKIKVGVIGAVVAAGLATGVIEVNANRGLHAELRELQGGTGNVTALAAEGRQLNAALQKAAANNSEVMELARLRQRAAVLAARPRGVLDEAMITAANWRDVGRATPEAATLTFHAAMFSRDLETVAKYVSFDDDTPKAREAFMAHFSEAVRAKYRTPEGILAAAFFGAGSKVEQPGDDALQILGVDDHVGGNGSRYGQKRVRVWYRAMGREFEGGTRWHQTPEGWAPAPFSLAKEWEFAVTNFDPVTGHRLPPKKEDDATTKK